ncbi:hypothetical protein D3C75_430200 [compost metagenome]
MRESTLATVKHKQSMPLQRNGLLGRVDTQRLQHRGLPFDRSKLRRPKISDLLSFQIRQCDCQCRVRLFTKEFNDASFLLKTHT